MKPISCEKSQIDINKFKKGRKISQGDFGNVFEFEEIETKNLYAAKHIICQDDESYNKLIEHEVCTMLHVEHPAIIKYIGYTTTEVNDLKNVIILMELAENGSLYNVIKSNMESRGPNNYTNTTRQIILVGVARGMKYLHDHGIIHSNLKPCNILLNSEFRPLITDYGLSKNLGGTKSYQAPEILKGEKYDGKVDVYAFGILMFEVLNDSFAYPEYLNGKMADSDFQSKVVNENYRPEFTFPLKTSLKKLIEKCWSNNPDDRPSFTEIFEKLSNTQIEDSEESENYLLDDVDVDELNFYVDDISENCDTTEKLLNKIKRIENEMKKLKKQNLILKNENDQNHIKIDTLEKENSKFKEEINNLRQNNNENQQNQVENLLSMNESKEQENKKLLSEIDKLKEINKKCVLENKEQEKHFLSVITKLKEENKQYMISNEQETNNLYKTIEQMQRENESLLYTIARNEDENKRIYVLKERIKSLREKERNLIQKEINAKKEEEEINRKEDEIKRKIDEKSNNKAGNLCVDINSLNVKNFNLFDEQIPGLYPIKFGKFADKRLDSEHEFRRLINNVDQNIGEILYLFDEEQGLDIIKNKLKMLHTSFDPFINELIEETKFSKKIEIINNFYQNNDLTNVRESIINELYPLVENIPSEFENHIKDTNKIESLFKDFYQQDQKQDIDLNEIELIKPPKNYSSIDNEELLTKYDKFINVVNIITTLRSLIEFETKFNQNHQDCSIQEELLTKEAIYKIKQSISPQCDIEQLKIELEKRKSKLIEDKEDIEREKKEIIRSKEDILNKLIMKNDQVYVTNFNLLDEQTPKLQPILFSKYAEKRLDSEHEFRRLINDIDNNISEILYLFDDEQGHENTTNIINVLHLRFKVIINELIEESEFSKKIKIINNFYQNNDLANVRESIINELYPLVKNIPSEFENHIKDINKIKLLFKDFYQQDQKQDIDLNEIELIKPPKNYSSIDNEELLTKYDKFINVVNIITTLRSLIEFENKFNQNHQECSKQEELLTREIQGKIFY